MPVGKGRFHISNRLVGEGLPQRARAEQRPEGRKKECMEERIPEEDRENAKVLRQELAWCVLETSRRPV